MTSGRRVALVGSPNSGKTTLFNALTGLRRRVANYPGVTVDFATGAAVGVSGPEVTVIDLPGAYSLDPLSADEAVTTRALRGALEGEARPDGVLVVADATTLRRSMQSILEVLALGLPAVVVITMVDELQARGGSIRFSALSRMLGVPAIGVVGNRGIGLDAVRDSLGRVAEWTPAPPRAASAETPAAGGDSGRSEGGADGVDHAASPTAHSDAAHAALVDRFAAADAIVDAAVVEPDSRETASDRADRVLLHPVWGLIIFAAAMFLFFQAIFVVAAPLQDLCEGAVLALGEVARQVLSEGLVQSLIVDGVIAGVGGVVVFVPQIAILLLLLRLMEGSGYMARAAFLVDRVMGSVGLEGRSFVALLSSYACAVPGIMATRTIPDPRSRLATILVAPLMTCSARLPVYALLIGAFVPARSVLGVFSLQGIVLLALYALGSAAAFGVAAVLHRIGRRRAFFPFYMELPPYRLPSAKALLTQTWQGVRAFLRKAGTVILAASVVLWSLLSFPKVVVPDAVVASASTPEEADALASAYALEHSAAASIGHAMEPIVAPLGYDWRIGVGILGSFAAREVIVATLAQLFAFSAGEDDIGGLGERIAAECQPVPETEDCVPKYTLATALSLLVFFVFSLQCVSTLAVIRRETGTWRWPAFAFAYMLGLAYVCAWLTYVAARALGA